MINTHALNTAIISVLKYVGTPVVLTVLESVVKYGMRPDVYGPTVDLCKICAVARDVTQEGC